MKSSDHEEGQRIAFSLKSVTIGQDEHGDPITAPVVVEQAVPFAPAKKAALSPAAKVSINALQEAIDDLRRDPAGLQPHPADDEGGDHGSLARIRLPARHQRIRRGKRPATGVRSRA